MEYKQLGKSGLRVSRIALGTMNFGPVLNREDSFRVLDTAFEAGINLIDTADQYGGPGAEGSTEVIVGEWIESRGCREQIVLATKYGEPMGPGPNNAGASALHISRALQASLRRLQLDSIDLYQLHHVDRTVSWQETVLALETHRLRGDLTYYGTSNCAGWHLADAANAADNLGAAGWISEQHRFSLAQRTAELEVLPSARAHGMGVLAWSPLAGGLLSGSTPRFGSASENQEMMRREESRLQKYRHLCDELGATMAQVSLAWLLHQPGLTAPLVGARTPDQIESLAFAAQLKLSSEVLAELDTLWPGPGGAAPEAYAW